MWRCRSGSTASGRRERDSAINMCPASHDRQRRWEQQSRRCDDNDADERRGTASGSRAVSSAGSLSKSASSALKSSFLRSEPVSGASEALAPEPGALDSLVAWRMACAPRQWLRLSPSHRPHNVGRARETNPMTSKNSFGSRATLTVDGKTYTIFRLAALDKSPAVTPPTCRSASRFCSRTCCGTKTTLS